MRAVLFDLYGTLVRTDDPLRELNAIIPLSSRAMVGTAMLTRKFDSFDDIMQMMTEEYHIKFIGKEIAHHIDALRERLERAPSRVTLYDDAIPALDALRNEGIPVGLVSNLLSMFKEPFYRLGLDQYIAAPVFSCDVGYRKPDRRIFILACERLGARPDETIMIGDSRRSDIYGANAAGLRSIYLSRNNASSIDHIRSLDALPVFFCR
jgi:HAD superfamily hydrolase (TIGR01549 family)